MSDRLDEQVAHRLQRYRAVTAVLIGTATAMLDTPRVRGGLWRRAVRSKNRRIRRKGERLRAKAQAAADSVWRVLAAVSGQVQASVVMSQRPPRNVSKGWRVGESMTIWEPR